MFANLGEVRLGIWVKESGNDPNHSLWFFFEFPSGWFPNLCEFPFREPARNSAPQRFPVLPRAGWDFLMHRVEVPPAAQLISGAGCGANDPFEAPFRPLPNIYPRDLHLLHASRAPGCRDRPTERYLKLLTGSHCKLCGMRLDLLPKPLEPLDFHFDHALRPLTP